MGLHSPRLAHRGVAVVRLRGVLSEAGAGLRQVFTTDPQLVIADLGGLRGRDESGPRLPAGIAGHPAAQVLCGAGGCGRPPAVHRATPDRAWRVPRRARHVDRPHHAALEDAPTSPTCPPPEGIATPRLPPHALAGEWAKALLGSWELSSEPTADAVAYELADTVEISLRPWGDRDGVRWPTVAVRPPRYGAYPQLSGGGSW